MAITMDDISGKLFQIIKDGDKNLDVIKDELNSLSPVDLIIYEFSQPYGNTYPAEFMLTYFRYWKSLDYEDFSHILNEIKNYNLGMYCYLPFFYKYLDIDLVDVFFSLEGVTDNARNYTIGTIKDQSSIFEIDDFDRLLLEYANISLSDLKKVSEKLINQGAKEAKHPIKNYQEYI